MRTALAVFIAALALPVAAQQPPGLEPLPEAPPPPPLIEGDGLGVTRTYRWYADVGLWTEARWRIADGKLTVKPAARVDYLGIADRWTFDPRLVVSHELAPWFTLRESLGVAHQPPGPLYLFADEIDPRYAVQAAVHTSIGAHVRWPGEVRTSVTWFDARFGGPGAPAARIAGLQRRP